MWAIRFLFLAIFILHIPTVTHAAVRGVEARNPAMQPLKIYLR